MKLQRHELLQSIEKIVSDVADLKKIIILDFKPSSNGKRKAILNDFNGLIEELSPLWDNITAVQEIRKQREK